MNLVFRSRQDVFRFCAEELGRLGVLMEAMGMEGPAGCAAVEIKQ